MPDGDSRLALGYGLFRTAVYWGLRSPYSDSYSAYNINAGGTVYSVYVYYPYFAARPALMEYRVQVAFWRKQRTIIKGGHILSSSQAPYPLLPPDGRERGHFAALPLQAKPADAGLRLGKGCECDGAYGGDKHNGSDTGRLATGERPRTPHTGEILAAISAAKPAPTIQFQTRMRDYDL